MRAEKKLNPPPSPASNASLVRCHCKIPPPRCHGDTLCSEPWIRPWTQQTSTFCTRICTRHKVLLDVSEHVSACAWGKRVRGYVSLWVRQFVGTSVCGYVSLWVRQCHEVLRDARAVLYLHCCRSGHFVLSVQKRLSFSFC